METLIFKGEVGEKTLTGAVFVCFYPGNVKGKQEKQVTHTYNLIQVKIFMQTTKWNKEKLDIIRW